jgi:NitT/TauT family transport system substrate-binding protein
MQAGRWRSVVIPLVVLGIAAAACGGDDDEAGPSSSSPPAATAAATTSGSGATDATDTGDAPAASGDGATLKVGYSAWPGWFPLAVAEQEGIFEQAGVKVELTYFADYISSLDALVAGSIDVNTQTLNDTIFGVAAGSAQRIFLTNDNSTGNDAIICDASITTVEDLKGTSIAAEPGVVDHFLLLQGLQEAGMKQEDIEFSGLPTDAAAAAFAGGQFDCVGVFAPFTTQALARAGSHVLFSSKDYPGSISDHFVATTAVATEHPAELQKLVDAWYLTLEWIKDHPAEATEIMAEKAAVTPEEYAAYAAGTTIFDAQQALDSFADRAGDPTSLPEMARRINPFLVESGLTKQEADLADLFMPEFTQDYVDGSGG